MTSPPDHEARDSRPGPPRRELTTNEFLDAVRAEIETPIGESTLPPGGLASSEELRNLAHVRRVVGEKVGDILALLVELTTPSPRPRTDSSPG